MISNPSVLERVGPPGKGTEERTWPSCTRARSAESELVSITRVFMGKRIVNSGQKILLNFFLCACVLSFPLR